MRCLSLFRLFVAFAGLRAASAQSSSGQPPSSTPSVSLSLTTSSITVTSTTRSGGQNTQIVTVLPTTYNVTYTPTPTSSATASASESALSSASATPVTLDTRLDPAFGVLGAVLILTGLPSAFWGHKNRWTSFFLIGFYTLSLVCFVLILRFGVLNAVNPPSNTLRGMFVLASSIAGIAGGAVAIFFWKAARYCIGGWGGFAFGLWIQCFRTGGLIHATSYRWIMYIGCAVVGFVLCTVPKIHYHILLISTAFVGSSAFMLGVDCYTTAGLKEFYVWNLGFRSLFPKFQNNGIEFPVSQTMQIELGLIAAVAVGGSAVQLRILTVLQRKLREIAAEQKQRDEEAEIQAASRFGTLLREQEEWEKDHVRHESGYSSIPLMKDHDGSNSPATPEYRSSDLTLLNGSRPRAPSGISEFLAAPTPDDELRRAARSLQSPGALPTLDLGLGIQDDVPQGFMANEISPNKTPTTAEAEDVKRKQELVAEIQTLRRSIDALKADTPTPSSSGDSRRPSLASRRTLSIDANHALLPNQSHLRPPREPDPRGRVHSMDLRALAQSSVGESITRPTSAPLRDLDWDAYVQERRLLQPPSGVTAPITTTPLTSSRIQMPTAVTDALNRRKRKESLLGLGGDPQTDSSEDVPLSKLERHQRSSSGGNIPITILPPKKVPIIAPTPQRPPAARTKTFEELNERHREKMRDLQGPLTQAEKHHADLEAAKQRWERSKAVEREAMAKRQAEKAAQLERRKRSEEEERPSRAPVALDAEKNRRHSRSLSADKLGGSASRRLSTIKVEDWQRYQQREASVTKKGRSGLPFPERGV